MNVQMVIYSKSSRTSLAIGVALVAVVLNGEGAHKVECRQILLLASLEVQVHPIELVVVEVALEAVAVAVAAEAHCWLTLVCCLVVVQAYRSCFHRCVGY